MPVVNRIDPKSFNTAIPAEDGDIDTAISEVVNDSKLETLNDEGRNALNKAGATLMASARTLASLLDSPDEDMQFKASKLVLERHAGRLEGSKESKDTSINIIIGGGFNTDGPNIFNPNPVQIESS